MSNSDNYFIWSKLDLDDETMNRPEIIKHLADKYPEVTVKWGHSENKIHAINRDMEDLPECDIMILQSDDIIWDVKGFDDIIREAFCNHSPDFSYTIHFPDDHGGRNTIIVSILGINLYKKIGYLYFPKCVSVYADNIFTEMTRAMKKYVFVPIRLFTHAHPIWGSVPWDKQYKATEAKENYAKDRQTYLEFQAQNYGL